MAFASMPFPFLSKYLQALILIVFYANLLCFQHVIAPSNESDYLALLKFKQSIIDDPYEILSSWNSSNQFCTWTGITCSHKHQRVIVLNLGGYHLGGIISPYVGNLSFLIDLYLPDNNLHGEIPPELGRLFRLKQLSLTNNTLTGTIPWNLTSCTELRHLNLSRNSLTGEIPFQLGNLKKLEKLVISMNNLTGQIPFSLWNLSSLNDLIVIYNHLKGSIPEEIGHLKNLRQLGLASNNFSGALPSSLHNMSSLTRISVAVNHINGTLPNNMFSTLTNLQFFAIGGNHISGSIPNSIINASSLQLFDIALNYFVGEVPDLGTPKDLKRLNLGANNLGSSSNNDLNFITSLKKCSKLEILNLKANNFGGVLPDSIGNLSTQLIQLYLSFNHIHANILGTLGKYTNLIVLDLGYNQFSSTIPASFGSFHKMQQLSFMGNQLSGEIPVSLGNLSQLSFLGFSENMLEGRIPPIFGNMKSLLYLDLAQNNFNGVIPLQIFGLTSLSILLNLSYNSLSGSLPIEVGTLKNLGTLDISENHLSGEIPSSIGETVSMEYLNLQGNLFNGSMPPSLALLRGLTHLDISRNNLSGPILIGLQHISSLQYLNVSFNMLEGKVPIEGVFSNASAVSVKGNIHLCGGISKLHLAPCPIKIDSQRKHHNLKLMTIMICVAFSFLLIIMLAFYWRRERIKKSYSTSLTIEQLSKVSYQDLHFATESFSTNNLIGLGSFGSVYKGRLELEDKVVAIKVLNLQKRGAQKSFISECNALKNIRHRNLVKILTCCSSIDYNGQEFKALVFEYMSNGSLEKWLHPNLESAGQCPTLGLHQRFNVIYDVVSALHYLHHECEQPIVHCDVKPSNVLLDDDMVAHVSDFGLARLLSTPNSISPKQSSSVGIKGTIGYTPPVLTIALHISKYGISYEVSTQGDVYSFGILVLEMLTGRKPIEEMFEDGCSLYSYVKAAYPNNLLEVVDLALIPQPIQQKTTTIEEEIGMEEATLLHHNDEKCLFSLFEIGLACSVESPSERLNMMDVLRELNQLRNTFLSGERNGCWPQNKE